MSPGHDQNGMSVSNGSHRQVTETISNEKYLLTELWPIYCPFWVLVICVKAGHLKTTYEFARILHEGI